MASLTLRQINKIPVAERILMAERLWESIPEHSDKVGLTSFQVRELDDRLDRLEKGRLRTASWPQVKAKMRARRA
ncbi:MAG: addiction module protein [Chitinispirillaceae bacterium]|nr:addiction module protein [Chitinispirillaceae bacterium]